MTLYVAVVFGGNASLTGQAYVSYSEDDMNNKAKELEAQGATVRVGPLTISDPPVFDPSRMPDAGPDQI